MKTLKIIVLLAIGTFFGSCETKSIQELEAEAMPPVVTNPTYNKNIAPVISNKCISCHAPGMTSPNLSDYNRVKDNCDETNGGNILCRIDDPTTCFGSIMPPTSNGGRMSQATIDMIKLWVAQGFIEN